MPPKYALKTMLKDLNKKKTTTKAHKLQFKQIRNLVTGIRNMRNGVYDQAWDV